MLSRIHIFFFALMGSLIFVSCKKKDEFLNAKPDQSLFTLSSLETIERLLDNTAIFNKWADPYLGLLSSDDYYASESVMQYYSAIPQIYNAYIWKPDIFPIDYNASDWSDPYVQVYNANKIIEALNNLNIDNAYKAKWNELKGSAQFFRSYAHFKLMQIFTLPYDKNLEEQLLGIPIRLNSDVTVPPVRLSQKFCYDQILTDMEEAAALLPDRSSIITRPSKLAAYGMLSRIYLSISDYENAKKYADSCLALNSSLADFNELQSDPYQLQPASEPYLLEDVFHSTIQNSYLLSFTETIVDSALYNMYDTNDLRRTYYFTEYDGNIRFKGSFETRNFGYLFSGLATGEILLNRAEANIRLDNLQGGLDDLNTLLVKRYKVGTFTPVTTTSKSEGLTIVLNERRKELCFRGIRWLDLRRLNKEPEHAVTLKRVLGGQEYTLPPGDSRYALPIPYNEVLVSGIEQNQR